MIPRKLYSVGIVLTAFVSVGTGQAEETKWPIVAPIEKTVYFPDGKAAEIKLTINSARGESTYILECHTFEYEGDPSFDYSGDFECRLTASREHNVYSTLLTDDPDQSRDWQSRGRFLAEELEGPCRNYPEFGQIRHFRLRGMRLTLAIRDIAFTKSLPGKKPTILTHPRLKSFEFSVRVEPDEGAMSEIAEPIPYNYPARQHPNTKDPSLNCETIRLKEK